MEDLSRFVRDLKRDLDLIRQRVNNLETHEVPGGGAGSGLDADTVDGYDASDFASASHTHDASVITFTPAVAANWDGSVDPGDVDNALDQLAERVTDVEGSSGGGVSDLDDLSDVDTSGADDGDVLAYDSGTSSWRPVAPGSSGGVPVGLRLSRVDTRQIIDSWVRTQMIWDTEDYNPNSIVWSGGDITAPVTGVYIVYLNLYLHSVYHNNGTKVISIESSPGGLEAYLSIEPNTSGEYNILITAMGPVTKDELVRVYVSHDSGYDDLEVEGSITLNRIT